MHLSPGRTPTRRDWVFTHPHVGHPDAKAAGYRRVREASTHYPDVQRYWFEEQQRERRENEIRTIEYIGVAYILGRALGRWLDNRRARRS